jgi:hypothetical protein
MYTELFFVAELKGGTPESVIAVLEYAAGKREDIEDLVPDHPLFKCRRWLQVFKGCAWEVLGHTFTKFSADEDFGGWNLTIRSVLKNYDLEINRFLEWIHPWVDSIEGKFHGYSMYEEEVEPRLIFYGKNEFKADYDEAGGSYQVV